MIEMIFLDDSGRKISNQLFFVAFCCQAAWTNVKSPCIPEKGPEGLRKSMVHHKPWAVIFVRVVFPRTKTKVVVFCCFQIEITTLLGSNISHQKEEKNHLPSNHSRGYVIVPKVVTTQLFLRSKRYWKTNGWNLQIESPMCFKGNQDLPQKPPWSYMELQRLIFRGVAKPHPDVLSSSKGDLPDLGIDRRLGVEPAEPVELPCTESPKPTARQR